MSAQHDPSHQDDDDGGPVLQDVSQGGDQDELLRAGAQGGGGEVGEDEVEAAADGEGRHWQASEDVEQTRGAVAEGEKAQVAIVGARYGVGCCRAMQEAGQLVRGRNSRYRNTSEQRPPEPIHNRPLHREASSSPPP